MTPLHLVRFIEDTEGPFVLRLGGELKVLDVLCHNLPVGDEVALEVHQHLCGLDTAEHASWHSAQKLRLQQPEQQLGGALASTTSPLPPT